MTTPRHTATPNPAALPLVANGTVVYGVRAMADHLGVSRNLVHRTLAIKGTLDDIPTKRPVSLPRAPWEGRE